MDNVSAKVGERHAYHEYYRKYRKDADTNNRKHQSRGIKLVVSHGKQRTPEIPGFKAMLDFVSGEDNILYVRNINNDCKYQNEY